MSKPRRTSIPKIEKNFSLSVCVITKNEEKFIRKCLLSVMPIADEIIVVDTGNTDQTNSIAERQGAKIFPYKWRNDFSKARNYGLEQCTCQWILVLDADETVSSKDLPLIKQTIASTTAAAFILPFRLYSKDTQHFDFCAKPKDLYSESKAYPGWIKGEVIKLFKNDTRYRYCYPVHESIEEAILSSGGVIKELTVPTVHNFGKDKGDARQNQAYYHQLLQAELKKKSTHPRFLFYGAQFEMKFTKNWAKAESLLIQVLKKNRNHVLAPKLLALIYYEQKKYRKVILRLSEFQLADLSKNLLCLYARSAMLVKKTVLARAVFTYILNAFGAKDAKVLYQLASLEYRQNNIALAKLILKKILKINPNFTQAKNRLNQIESQKIEK